MLIKVKTLTGKEIEIDIEPTDSVMYKPSYYLLGLLYIPGNATHAQFYMCECITTTFADVYSSVFRVFFFRVSWH